MKYSGRKKVNTSVFKCSFCLSLLQGVFRPHEGGAIQKDVGKQGQKRQGKEQKEQEELQGEVLFTLKPHHGPYNPQSTLSIQSSITTEE